MTDDEEAMMERLVEGLERVESWSNAYPVEIFPEPTKEQWKQIADVLEANGFVLDAISASNMRRVVTGVGGIAKNALGIYDAWAKARNV